MNKDIRKDLISARDLKFSGNYKEALEIYERIYRENPEVFNYKNKEDYAWVLYRVHVQNFKNEDDFYRSAEFITSLVPQRDLNTNPNCIYTSAVFKVLKKLDDDNDYFTMLDWLDRINPELLDEKPYRAYGRINKSKKEKFYDYESRAYLNTGDFESCIEVSKLALDTFKTFRDDGDTWHYRRIGLSLKELKRYKEALPYLLEVIKVKHDWYMYRDIAEVYYRINKPFDALEYCCPVVLSNVSDNTKINIYYLIYNILKGFNQHQALKHAQFFYLLKKESGYAVPYDIEQLDIDESKLDKDQLESEIKEIWTLYKFKDQELQYGNVIKFFDDKNYDFIKPEDGKSIFFHEKEFKGDTIYVGQKVSFFTEKRFDKSKNRESLNAVYINSL